MARQRARGRTGALPTALTEAEATAKAAEAELLAMLDLDEPEEGAGGRSGKGTRGQSDAQREEALICEAEDRLLAPAFYKGEGS